MRRLLFPFSLLALVLLACNPIALPEPDANPSVPPGSTPLPTLTASVGPRGRCGDGVCEGPENASNCSQDCVDGAEIPAPSRTTPGATVGHEVSPVYVTVAGHIEDVPIYTNCDAYPGFRQELLQFAETLAPTGAAVNLQVDYEFFLGASRCETDAMQAETDGRNVLDYLATHYGYEIDAHQEGGWEEGADNYADVRFLGETVVPSISDNVGGLVWDDAEQFARLSEGEPGRLNPDYVWLPQILTLAVSHDHHLGDFSRDDIASGIWAPRGAGQAFWRHDPAGRLLYIGPGEHANWDASRPWQSTPEFVQALIEGMAQGRVDPDRMYTASIAVPQSIIFEPQRHAELLNLLAQLAPAVEAGHAVHVTYAEAVEIWRREYGSRPTVYFHEGTEPPAGDAPEAVTTGQMDDNPLYVGLSVHLEGYPLGNERVGYDEQLYDRYSERILAYSDLAAEYEMPLTWETANLIGPSSAFEPNVLLELYRRGDGVGVHADVGGDPRLGEDEERLAFQMRALRLEMEAMGIPVTHASGICSDQDWVSAAREAGYRAATGTVNYCLKSLPLEQQPAEVQACTAPGDGVCHDPYPGDIPAGLHPWRATDGATWTTPAQEGLLLIPTLGAIHGLYEAVQPDGSHTGTEMTQEDIDIALQLVAESVEARDPGQINGAVFVWSFGQAIDHDLLRAFFEGLQPYVESGDVVWLTLPEMVDVYEATETGGR